MVTITAPQDGSTVTDGTPVSFTGRAGKQVPTSPDQAGTIIHELPGSGWTEIEPGKWQNQGGDIEDRVLWRVNDLEWWGVAEASPDPNQFCQLFSDATGSLPPDGQDYWVCPTGAFLPDQQGFTAPDLSELIEWFDGQGNKIGEGATIEQMLSPGTHQIFAQVNQGGQTGQGGPVTVVVAAASQPTGAQGDGTNASNAGNLNQKPAANIQLSSGWLWLLLLLLALWLMEEKEKE